MGDLENAAITCRSGDDLAEIEGSQERRQRTFVAMFHALEVEYTGGRRVALLRALALVAQFRLTMPSWVADATLDASVAYRRGTARTLDDAFGIHRAKGWQRPKTRERQRREALKFAACLVMHSERIRGATVDEALEATANFLDGKLSEKTIVRAYYDKELCASIFDDGIEVMCEVMHEKASEAAFKGLARRVRARRKAVIKRT